MIHHITITPSFDSNQAARHTSRGPLFDVTYHGNFIVTASTEPCLDGARALKVMGISGKLELWDNVLPYCRLHADIDRAAKLTVREGDEPPRLVKYVSFAPRSAQDGDFGTEGLQIAPSLKRPSLDSPPAYSELSKGGAA
jgi:hypothetical protein